MWWEQQLVLPSNYVNTITQHRGEIDMKKLNITKERFEKSRYFTKKYGNLKYVSESGKMYKTDKGKVLKFVNEGLRRNGFDW